MPDSESVLSIKNGVRSRWHDGFIHVPGLEVMQLNVADRLEIIKSIACAIYENTSIRLLALEDVKDLTFDELKMIVATQVPSTSAQEMRDSAMLVGVDSFGLFNAGRVRSAPLEALLGIELNDAQRGKLVGVIG